MFSGYFSGQGNRHTYGAVAKSPNELDAARGFALLKPPNLPFGPQQALLFSMGDIHLRFLKRPDGQSTQNVATQQIQNVFPSGFD
jgi:hypothetical protein